MVYIIEWLLGGKMKNACIHIQGKKIQEGKKSKLQQKGEYFRIIYPARSINTQYVSLKCLKINLECC